MRPGTISSSWSLAPEIVLPLFAALIFYGKRVAAGGVARGRGACFMDGWLLLALALISPLCRAAASLATAHMVQRVILVATAPPLLALGIAPLLRPRAAPRWHHPGLIGGLHATAIWFAHAPQAYGAALLNPAAHLALCALLLSTSLLF